MSDMPPPGWKTDPDDPSQYRYWDGKNWTDQRAPREEAPAGGPSTTVAEAPKHDEAKPWWKKWWGITAIFIVIVAILGTCGETDEAAEDEPTASVSEQPVEVPTTAATELAEQAEDVDPSELDAVEPTEILTPPPSRSVENVPTLAFTPDEFATRWDQMAAEFDMSQLATRGISVESGEAQDIFQEKFADNLMLMGTVLHSGELRDVLLMSQASESNDENLLVMAAWGVMVSTLSPDLTNNERGDVLKELGLFTDDDAWMQDGYEATAVRGDVRYRLSYSDMIGWMFSGAPAES